MRTKLEGRIKKAGATKRGRFTLFVAMLALCLFCAQTRVEAAKVALIVTLPDSIEAREGSFYLGEYAEFEGDMALADSASMVLVTPDGGLLTRDEVIRALGTSPVAGQSVALRMPEAIQVLPESRIAAELRAMSGWKWRIEVIGVEADDRTDFSLPPKVQPGARAVAVKIVDESGSRGNKQAKLKWYQPVVYSLKPLAREARIDMANLRTRIDVIGMTGNFVWDPEQIRHAIPRAAVGALRPISMGDLTQVGAIRSGSSVTLVANVNGLGIEVQGIALQRGAIGDTIKVKNLSSKKVLYGKVIDIGRVQLN